MVILLVVLYAMGCSADQESEKTTSGQEMIVVGTDHEHKAESQSASKKLSPAQQEIMQVWQDLHTVCMNIPMFVIIEEGDRACSSALNEKIPQKMIDMSLNDPEQLKSLKEGIAQRCKDVTDEISVCKKYEMYDKPSPN
ncbi:MAG TPA: hypothetical protein VJA22_01810 [Patescibacteria group bacterium]|nr:hypothetical protein [Patescibacteria group bacterium]